MPLISEMAHPRGLSFAQQRKVVHLRDDKGLAWNKIAEKVINLQRQNPSEWLVKNTYKRFDKKAGRVRANYHKCGRKKYKVTPQIEAHLVKTLLRLRSKCTCTASTLQRELAREKNVELSCVHIRRVLRDKGYKWLPRNRKRVYSAAERKRRVEFAKSILEKTPKQLRTYFSMCLDGVVLCLPPADPVDRENYCRYGDGHLYMKPDEVHKDVASGSVKYAAQAPLSRVVPMWGGVGAKGFGLVTFHQRRKLNSAEWRSSAVSSGRLVAACQQASGRQRGPYKASPPDL